jgi:hypothetical protein
MFIFAEGIYSIKQKRKFHYFSCCCFAILEWTDKDEGTKHLSVRGEDRVVEEHKKKY